MAALLGFLLVGAVVAAVVSGRRIEGSVPGRSAILGLAATADGFLVGTSDGVLFSGDGLEWKRLPGLNGESLVASSGSGTAVVSGGTVRFTSDLETFRPVSVDLSRPTALTVSNKGRAWIADSRRLVVADATGEVLNVPLKSGPKEVLSLGVDERNGGDPGVLAGGLTAGLWQSRSGGTSWRRILGTPIRAILIDPGRPESYLIGTAGGVLAAGRTTPEFTELREPVEALAESEGTYYAITADRLLYESKDGLKWSARVKGG